MQRTGSRIIHDLISFSSHVTVYPNELPHYVDHMWRYVIFDLLTFGILRDKISKYVKINIDKCDNSYQAIKCNNFVQIRMSKIIGAKVQCIYFATTNTLGFYLNSAKKRKRLIFWAMWKYFLFSVVINSSKRFDIYDILKNPKEFLKQFNEVILLRPHQVLDKAQFKNKYRRNHNGKKFLSSDNHSFGEMVSLTLMEFEQNFVDLDHFKEKRRFRP